MITEKKVTRYYAAYLTWKGNVAQKGFGSRMAAARFLAKQAVFDKVFGLKNGTFDPCDGPDGPYYYKRDTPDDPAGRAAKWAEVYPLEECEGGQLHWGGIGATGDPYGCTYNCEMHGYAKCRVKLDLDDHARALYHGHAEYDPHEGYRTIKCEATPQ